jgi:hypothetical protein
VKPLDAGQVRELDFLRSQRTGWPYRSAGTRWTFVAGVSLVGVGAMAAVVVLANGPWLWIGSATVVVVVFLLCFSVFAPERALKAAVRMSTPTLDSMEKGDSNRNWPG